MMNIVQSSRSIHCSTIKYAIPSALCEIFTEKVYVLNQYPVASTASSFVVAGSSDLASIAVTTPVLRPGMGRSDSMEQINCQHILRSISVSPCRGKARELGVSKTRPQSSTTTNDSDLIPQSSKAPLYDQPGSAHNPITID